MISLIERGYATLGLQVKKAGWSFYLTELELDRSIVASKLNPPMSPDLEHHLKLKLKSQPRGLRHSHGA
jgi:hypothetical protein